MSEKNECPAAPHDKMLQSQPSGAARRIGKGPKTPPPARLAATDPPQLATPKPSRNHRWIGYEAAMPIIY